MSVRSIERAFSVLDCFSPEVPILSLNEICLKLELPKTTSFRILQTLVDAGYLLQSDDSRFELTAKILRLAECVRFDPDLVKYARPEIERAAAETNETVALSALVGNDRVVIDLVECSLPLKLVLRRGERNDRHTGATGRVFLAYDPVYFRKYLKTQKGKAAEIQEEIELVLKLGFAVTTNFRTQGSAGVAAPVFDMHENCTHSIGVYGPAERIIPNVDKIGRSMVDAADRISLRAGSRKLIRRVG